jgi:hypothetical protein
MASHDNLYLVNTTFAHLLSSDEVARTLSFEELLRLRLRSVKGAYGTTSFGRRHFPSYFCRGGPEDAENRFTEMEQLADKLLTMAREMEQLSWQTSCSLWRAMPATRRHTRSRRGSATLRPKKSKRVPSSKPIIVFLQKFEPELS